jgi:hypothetical protein
MRNMGFRKHSRHSTMESAKMNVWCASSHAKKGRHVEVIYSKGNKNLWVMLSHSLRVLFCCFRFDYCWYGSTDNNLETVWIMQDHNFFFYTFDISVLYNDICSDIFIRSVLHLFIIIITYSDTWIKSVSTLSNFSHTASLNFT